MIGSGRCNDIRDGVGDVDVLAVEVELELRSDPQTVRPTVRDE